MKLEVPTSPCTSCPYRKDTPPGVWHEDEYNKLALYDGHFQVKGSNVSDFELQNVPPLIVFLCHHSPTISRDAVCRGWLTVHSESIAVRLAMMNGQVTPEEVYADVKEELYASGAEAAKAGKKGIKRPSAKAVRLMRKIENEHKSRSRRVRRRR
jgi:hypothetical protein